MRLTSSPRVTSARTAACPSSAASFSTPAPSRSARSSWAPSAASRRAEAAPIPLAAPVIRTVRLFRFPILSLLCPAWPCLLTLPSPPMGERDSRDFFHLLECHSSISLSPEWEKEDQQSHAGLLSSIPLSEG